MNRIYAPLNQDLLPTLQTIEVFSSLQLPSIHIVGLPAPEVSEARERIRAAFAGSGFEFPRRRVVLNLSPASVRKRGTGTDLAMALAVLASEREGDRADTVAWGELSLEGHLRSPGQELRALYAAWSQGVERVILPSEALTPRVRSRIRALKQSGAFASRFPSLQAVASFQEAWKALQNPTHFGVKLETESPEAQGPAPSATPLLRLDPWLERVIGVAAAGDHHLLLLGSRGSGKTVALEWLSALASEPSAEVRALRLLLSELSQAARPDPTSPEPACPIRRIGAQVKASALVGSATPSGIRPGEFTLAHGGILHADEFPEWSRDSREALREPLESGRVTLTRVQGQIEFPARFQLAATGNLCPCGGWDGSRGSLEEDCRCAPAARRSYLARLSGPVLDRIDLVAHVPAPHRRGGGQPAPAAEASGQQPLAARVSRVRSALLEQLFETPGRMSPVRLEELLAQRPPLRAALDALGRQSHRDRHKILRLSLSLTAWDGLKEPQERHFLEALSFRQAAHA